MDECSQSKASSQQQHNEQQSQQSQKQQHQQHEMVNNESNNELELRKQFLAHYSLNQHNSSNNNKKFDNFTSDYHNYENYLKSTCQFASNNLNSYNDEKIQYSCMQSKSVGSLYHEDELKSRIIGNSLKSSTSVCSFFPDSNTNIDELDKSKHKDPIAHRLIEKKRRDRFNIQLERLKSLLPLNMNRKGKMRIEKVEIIEMSIEYICRLHKELENRQYRDPSSMVGNFPTCSRNSMDSDSNNNNNQNGTHESYNKGLNDGMSNIIKFLKALNQIENKINEQSYDHAENFKNHVLKAVASDSNVNLNAIIDSDLKPKMQFLSKITNDVDCLSIYNSLKSSSSSSSSDSSLVDSSVHSHSTSSLVSFLGQQTYNKQSSAVLTNTHQSNQSFSSYASSLVDSYEDNYMQMQPNLYAMLNNSTPTKGSTPPSITCIQDQQQQVEQTQQQQYFQQQQPEKEQNDVQLLDLDKNTKTKYKKFKNDLITSHLKSSTSTVTYYDSDISSSNTYSANEDTKNVYQ